MTLTLTLTPTPTPTPNPKPNPNPHPHQVFAGLWSLSGADSPDAAAAPEEHAAAMHMRLAREKPDGYVMKPQREVGHSAALSYYGSTYYGSWSTAVSHYGSTYYGSTYYGSTYYGSTYYAGRRA